MIIKYFELKKKLNKHVNFYLLYGNNKGLIDETISLTLKPIFPKNVINYEENEILNKSETFYDSILNKSFFDNEKLIIIDRASDKILKIIEDIIEKKIDDLKIILTAGILEKKSKLRNFFEKDKNLISIPVYKDDHRTLLNIANNFFKQKKIVISPESLNLIIERSSEDRKNLKNELYKIENFIGNKKKIDINDLTKLTNLSENHSINKIVDLSLAKNTKLTLRALNENIFSTEDVIIIIRSYLVKSKRLLKLTTELEKNKNIDQVISAFKPPVFWKDKEIVKKQMAIWTKDNVKILIKNINNVELLLKKNTNSSINILRNFIIEQSSLSNN